MFQSYNREGLKTGEAYRNATAEEKANDHRGEAVGGGGVFCMVSSMAKGSGFQSYSTEGTAGKTMQQINDLAEAEAKRNEAKGEASTEGKQSEAEAITDKIILFECGQLDEAETVSLFQSLVNSGLAWKLQGHYGRTAHALLKSGRIKAKNEIDSLVLCISNS